MVLVSFSDPKFIPKILSGEKHQTCRPYKERQLRILKNNLTLHLWYKSRTPERQKLGEVQRTGLELIRLQPGGVIFMNKKFEEPFFKDGFARLDGFLNYDEMYSWFAKRNPDLDTQEFMCIRWDPATLVPAAAPSPAKTTIQEGEA